MDDSDTRALLYGLIGFILGGLLVSIAAHTFDKDQFQSSISHHSSHSRITS